MSEFTALEMRDELMTAFATYWAGRTPVAAQNVDFKPEGVTGDAYVRVWLRGRSEGQTRYSFSVQRNLFRRQGRLGFEVYVRENTDLDVAYGYAEDILKFLEKPGLAHLVVGFLSSPAEMGTDGAWFQVAVGAQWFYFTDRTA